VRDVALFPQEKAYSNNSAIPCKFAALFPSNEFSLSHTVRCIGTI
jgi:hypothetical protein